MQVHTSSWHSRDGSDAVHVRCATRGSTQRKDDEKSFRLCEFGFFVFLPPVSQSQLLPRPVDGVPSVVRVGAGLLPAFAATRCAKKLPCTAARIACAKSSMNCGTWCRWGSTSSGPVIVKRFLNPPVAMRWRLPDPPFFQQSGLSKLARSNMNKPVCCGVCTKRTLDFFTLSLPSSHCHSVT